MSQALQSQVTRTVRRLPGPSCPPRGGAKGLGLIRAPAKSGTARFEFDAAQCLSQHSAERVMASIWLVWPPRHRQPSSVWSHMRVLRKVVSRSDL